MNKAKITSGLEDYIESISNHIKKYNKVQSNLYWVKYVKTFI